MTALLELKIRTLTLGAESRINKVQCERLLRRARRLESKQKTSVEQRAGYAHVRHHRITVVRPAARISGLAYGFLKGRLYREIENKTHQPVHPDTMKAVLKLVVRFGGEDIPEAAWQAWWEAQAQCTAVEPEPGSGALSPVITEAILSVS